MMNIPNKWIVIRTPDNYNAINEAARRIDDNAVLYHKPDGFIAGRREGSYTNAVSEDVYKWEETLQAYKDEGYLEVDEDTFLNYIAVRREPELFPIY